MEQTIQNQLHFKEKLFYTLKRSKGIPIETDLAPYTGILKEIKKYHLKNRTDSRLKEMCASIKQRARSGESLKQLLPGLYALVREVFARTLGLRPYDVQLIGAIVLHQGKLAQMQTGEGKTLAIVFAAIAGALTGAGVHVMTANDYLTKRDAGWMGPVYDFLGFTTGYIQEKMGTQDRKKAYHSDVTYLTAKEGGFDLLRDHLQYNRDNIVQRDYNLAIIDEADFILIDEARIPLVIAGHALKPEIDPCQINSIIPELVNETDYIMEKTCRRIYLTLAGQKKVQQLLGCGGIHEQKYTSLYAAVHVALHAHYLLTRDVDYIVRNGSIELVDENTGRVADKRRWPYGIQPALEAKEDLELQPEGRIYGSITIQHYINLYPRISALTATAVSGAKEFSRFYGLDTVIIPPNKPVMRVDAPDMVFLNRKAKIDALIREIKRVHATGRPILVGTRSCRESAEIADILNRENVRCRVLNAKNDEKEAEFVACAGMPGAVTISTNMAGRGTDIKLGGEDGASSEKIKSLGGLYVIGTNRHESVRIDNQLRGRAGRQGDPGLSRFFISLEDDVMKRYGIYEFIPKKYLTSESGQPVQDSRVAKEIARAQEIIEDQNYEIRRTLRRYSELVERQRKHIHQLRATALKELKIPEDLWEQCNERFYKLSGRIGKAKVRQALVHIFIYSIDQFWADHLLFIELIKEGIHLHHFASKQPLLVFIQQVSDAYDAGLKQIIQKTAERFNHIRIKDKGINMEKLGISGPSGTWTYLINDNPMPGFKVALIASGNIGAASIAAIPVMIIELGKTVYAWAKRLWRKVFKRKG